MRKKHPSLLAITELDSPLEIVDIGANFIEPEGPPPYKPLLDAGVARITGFEPNPKALARLNDRKGPNETYIGEAVYDGTEQELKLCAREGMTSLLEPNYDLMKHFYGYAEWAAIEKREKISTVRLDDVKEIERIDFLKIDVQGAEYEIFRNGAERLRECLVVQSEVEFLRLYENQPLFSDIEIFLREQGLIFHRFHGVSSSAFLPMIVDKNPRKGLSQFVWAEAIFVRDFTKFDDLTADELKKIALVVHDLYVSYDLAHLALLAHDRKSETKLAEAYMTLLT